MSLLGIDLGTSGIKCVAYNENGKVLAKTYKENNLNTPGPGIVELNPNNVWSSLCENIRELSRTENVKKDPVEALSISVSGDEALPIDKKGDPLYNTIMSMDKRGLQENKFVNGVVGMEKIYKITGQPPSPMYALNRLLWLKNNKPGIFSKMYKFLCWEDYVLFKLGADPSTDYSVASRTLAFDIEEKKWSDEILDKVQISKSLFPDVYPSGSVVGMIKKEVARELGLKTDVKLVTGGLDQVCAALGAGVVKGGMASVGTGTMEVMQVCFENLKEKNKLLLSGYPVCNHTIEDLYICLTINFCAGVLLKWYKDVFLEAEKENVKNNDINIYDVMLSNIDNAVQPVLFYPYFEGTQSLDDNPYINGAMFGLNLRTRKEDIIKGILEGITFDLRKNMEKIEETGINIDTIRAIGGGAKSEKWLQLKADITGKIIQKLNIDEAGCLASAVLAGYAIGKYNNIKETINDFVKVEKEFKPDPDKFNGYSEKYGQFLDIFKNIKDYKIIY